MWEVITSAALLIWGYATFWFLISIRLKRNDVADIAWGLGYVLLAWLLWATEKRSSHALLVYLLTTIWGLRLAIHIFLRNRQKKEDFRYKQWREDWGKNVLWRSYLQVYVLQAFFLLIIATPLFVLSQAEEKSWNLLTYLGIGFWLLGFYFQAVGDHQLMQFKKRRKSKEEVLQTGLWKYSRHPNYFGEIVMWWAVFLIVLPLPLGWLAVISPLTITFLLIFVSGIPMLEKKYEGYAEFEAYKKRTSVLIPWWPK